MNEYPCWRYHDDGARRIFNTAEDLAAAGTGWHDSPAKIDPRQPQAAPEVAIEPEALEADAEPDPEATMEDLDKEDLQKLADEYGVEYDKRWGRSKMIDAIKFKLEQGGGAVASE